MDFLDELGNFKQASFCISKFNFFYILQQRTQEGDFQNVEIALKNWKLKKPITWALEETFFLVWTDLPVEYWRGKFSFQTSHFQNWLENMLDNEINILILWRKKTIALASTLIIIIMIYMHTRIKYSFISHSWLNTPIIWIITV